MATPWNDARELSDRFETRTCPPRVVRQICGTCREEISACTCHRLTLPSGTVPWPCPDCQSPVGHSGTCLVPHRAARHELRQDIDCCYCGSDTCACQACGTIICGTRATWTKAGNVGPCCMREEA